MYGVQHNHRCWLVRPAPRNYLSALLLRPRKQEQVVQLWLGVRVGKQYERLLVFSLIHPSFFSRLPFFSSFCTFSKLPVSRTVPATRRPPKEPLLAVGVEVTCRSYSIAFIADCRAKCESIWVPVPGARVEKAHGPRDQKTMAALHDPLLASNQDGRTGT